MVYNVLMLVSKCDKCKKVVKKDKVVAGFGIFNRFEFCEKCGKPIVLFLKQNKLLKKKLKLGIESGK